MILACTLTSLGPQLKGQSNKSGHAPEESGEDFDETASKQTALSETKDTTRKTASARVAMDITESSSALGAGSSDTAEKSDSGVPATGTAIATGSGSAVERLGPEEGVVEGQGEGMEGEGGEGREGEEGEAEEGGDDHGTTVKSTQWRPPHVVSTV